MSNASALFRSLIVYGVCLPLAVFLGYLLANPLEYTTVGVLGIVLFVLVTPLLLRWHHTWLLLTWNTTALLFFVPGKPSVWMGLAVASFAISILQYTLNRKMKFLEAPSVVRPLIFLTAVILLTARLTGGLGVRIFGGDTYGGKRYFVIIAAVLGFFALINRRIPPKRATLYVTLFFLGSATLAIGDLAGVVGSTFNFLFIFFPITTSISALTEDNNITSQASIMYRPGGLASLSVAFFCAMLARYGIRGVLDTTKPWRLVAFCLVVVIGLLTGFRSVLVLVLMTFTVLFYLERLHHTRLLIPVILASITGGGLLMIFAGHLPLPMQRSLAVLPFVEIDPVARMLAQTSSGWRVSMWQDVVPTIPQYLLVGKGYSFSATEQAQMGGGIENVELVGDYHNGPLSVILPFGIFGAIGFIWFVVAGIRVVYQNYQFGDPAYHNLNTFIFAYFIVKVFFFFTVFGSLHSDLPMYLGMLGLSISLNGGVAKPVVVPRPKVVFNRFKLHPSVRRPAGA